MTTKTLKGSRANGTQLTNFNVDYHRNGIAGTSFHVVTFDSDEGGETSHMLAVVFPDAGSCAVFDRDLIGAGEIRFFHNSYRGDVYETALREVIEAWHINPAEVVGEGLPIDEAHDPLFGKRSNGNE